MARSLAGDEGASLEGLVGRLDEESVRRLLVTAAEAHEDVLRAVRLAAADDADRAGVLRAEVDRGLQTRRHLGYWESSAWARDASPVVDALAEAVAAGPSGELVVLLERAAGHLVKVILRADDSDGMIGDLARTVLDLHQTACATGVADPVALARWMVRFSFEDQDFFVVDPVGYAGALGDKGLATYRKEVAKRSAPAEVTPLRRDLSAPFPSHAARYAAERLAVIDGDTGRLIELLGGDLSSPHQFTRVAEAMVELGRHDDALAWARRGIAETNGWQVAKLYNLATDLLAGRQDTDAVLALRREQHQRIPSSSTYALLQAAATAQGMWAAECDEARAVLAARDPGGYVDALLADGEIDDAWTVATGVYLRLADAALVNASKGAYRDAVKHLKAARRCATAAGMSAEFEERLAGLRQQHRRRPTLITMLDKAGLR